jgi:hypothetical protein
MRVEDVPMGYRVVSKVGNGLAADVECDRILSNIADNDSEQKERWSEFISTSISRDADD